MQEKHDKRNLSMIAIVAIVAIVALIWLSSQSLTSRETSFLAEDTQSPATGGAFKLLPSFDSPGSVWMSSTTDFSKFKGPTFTFPKRVLGEEVTQTFKAVSRYAAADGTKALITLECGESREDPSSLCSNPTPSANPSCSLTIPSDWVQPSSYLKRFYCKATDAKTGNSRIQPAGSLNMYGSAPSFTDEVRGIQYFQFEPSAKSAAVGNPFTLKASGGSPLGKKIALQCGYLKSGDVSKMLPNEATVCKGQLLESTTPGVFPSQTIYDPSVSKMIPINHISNYVKNNLECSFTVPESMLKKGDNVQYSMGWVETDTSKKPAFQSVTCWLVDEDGLTSSGSIFPPKIGPWNGITVTKEPVASKAGAAPVLSEITMKTVPYLKNSKRVVITSKGSSPEGNLVLLYCSRYQRNTPSADDPMGLRKGYSGNLKGLSLSGELRVSGAGPYYFGSPMSRQVKSTCGGLGYYEFKDPSCEGSGYSLFFTRLEAPRAADTLSVACALVDTAMQYSNTIGVKWLREDESVLERTVKADGTVTEK